MTVVLLLVVIAVLLYTHKSGRNYTVGVALLIAAFTWLAIEIHPLRIMRDIFAVAVENWLDVVMALGAALLLIVPAIMLVVAIRDHFTHRTVRQEFFETHGAIRSKFERRVATMLALGYNRVQAENTAVRLMKRDLSHHQTAKLAREIASSAGPHSSQAYDSDPSLRPDTRSRSRYS